MAEVDDIAWYESPTGTIRVTGNKNGITTLYFVDEKPGSKNTPDSLKACMSQLAEYFEGTRQEFELNLAPEGTDFQKRVWNELLHIGYGEVVSYLDIANVLGDKNATRAVGAANGQNPISVIVPCHRVIGSDGSLTGYGGGLHRKKWLLEFEGAPIQTSLF